MPLTQAAEFGAALDTGGIMIKADSGATVNNIFIFQDSTGQKWQRIIESEYRASWAGCFGVGDKTSIIQAVLNHSLVQTVVIDNIFTISGTLTVPTGKKLRFETGGRIDGAGTVTGGIVIASNRQQIFSSTLTITNIRTNDGIWSAMWLGAKGDGVTDDVTTLQKSIDYVIANSVNVKSLYFPGGTYKITKGLLVLEKNGAEYNQVNIRLFGDIMSQRMVAGDETWISCTSDSSFAIGLQENKGTVIENLGFKGTNAISYSQTVAYSPGTTYVLGAQRTNRFSPQAGICFDPFAVDVLLADQYPDFPTYYTNDSNGGCTSCVVKNVKLESFVVGIVTGPNGYVANNESHYFEHIWLSNMRQGISTCYGQERQTKCVNIIAWANVKTLFDTQTYGSRHGDLPIIDGVNTAGNVYELIYFGGGSGSTTTIIKNVHCESLYRIGSSLGHLSATFIGCNFNIVDPIPLGLKMQDWIYEDGNVNRTEFIGCNILYFTASGMYPMNFATTNVVFRNSTINQQVGTFYGTNGALLPTGAQYDNVSFYGVTGRLMNRNISGLGTNYSGYTGGRYTDMGNIIATVNPATGVANVLTYQTKQMRQVTSSFIKRVGLGSVAVTVTGNTATCTVASLANVAAYNNRMIYVYLGYDYVGHAGMTYSGGQVMRLVSIDGAGVITFDRVMESFVSGTYLLYVEILTTLPVVSVADVSGTAVTNWYAEKTGIFTPSANGLYTVGGAAAYHQTTITVGVGTATLTASQVAGRVTYSACEYIEWGISHMNPAVNSDFPQYTVFTKGAMYTNPAYNSASSDVVYWLCTKSGCKGSTVIEPEFMPVYASAPQDYSDKFTLTATGSRTIALGQTLYEIHLKSTVGMTLDIGTAPAGTDVSSGLILAANVTQIIDYKRTADSAFTLYFTSAAWGGGTLTIRLVKKTVL